MCCTLVRPRVGIGGCLLARENASFMTVRALFIGMGGDKHRAVVATLERRGLSVERHVGLDGAVEAFSGGAWDVVVLEHGMAGANTASLAGRLRTTPRGRQTALVVISEAADLRAASSPRA